MPSRRTLIRTSRIVAITLLIAVGLLGAMLVVRSGMRLYHRLQGPPPARPHQLAVTDIQGWMTVPYVARAFRMPPDELFSSLGVALADHRHSSLTAIASRTGRTTDEVLLAVQNAVTAYQAAHPAPSGPDPGRIGPRPRAPTPGGTPDRSLP